MAPKPGRREKLAHARPPPRSQAGSGIAVCARLPPPGQGQPAQGQQCRRGRLRDARGFEAEVVKGDGRGVIRAKVIVQREIDRRQGAGVARRVNQRVVQIAADDAAGTGDAECAVQGGRGQVALDASGPHVGIVAVAVVPHIEEDRPVGIAGGQFHLVEAGARDLGVAKLQLGAKVPRHRPAQIGKVQGHANLVHAAGPVRADFHKADIPLAGIDRKRARGRFKRRPIGRVQAGAEVVHEGSGARAETPAERQRNPPGRFNHVFESIHNNTRIIKM